MKKIFTLIAIMFSITAFAAPGPKTAKIAISNNDHSIMQVKIDGAMYNLGSSLVLENIRSGNHSITIYKTESFGFRKRSQVIYNSTMLISPAQLINIDINRFGKIVVKTVTEKFNGNDRNNGYGRDNNDRYNNDRGNRSRDYDNRYERH